MNLAVLGSRIFVRPELNETETADGLLHLVRDNARSINQGTVVAVGDGPDDINRAITTFKKQVDAELDKYVLDEFLDPGVRAVVAYLKHRIGDVARKAQRTRHVTPGDRIIFSPEAGEEIRFENDVVIVMKETDALAVIEEETE